MQKCSMWKPETNNEILSTRLPQWRDSRKKYNNQGEIRTLLGKNCEVEKIMSFFGNIRMFEEI